MDRRMSSDLDRHITGKYGEDQFNEPLERAKKTGKPVITATQIRRSTARIYEWPLTEEGINDARLLISELSDSGWCAITDLSGPCDEHLYMAVHNDDSKTLFEVGKGTLRLLLSREQQERIDSLPTDSSLQIMASIVVWFTRWQKQTEGADSITKLLHELENLTVDQMLELVKKSGNTTDRRFRVKGPTGSLEGKIVDVHFGLLEIDGQEGPVMAKDFRFATDLTWQLI
jgi:hypothetical protein